MHHAPPRPCRFASLAASTLAFGAFFTLPPQASAQDTPQAPAPIVRVRPRPQTGVPSTAPPDAAPLVNRAVRPRPSPSTQNAPPDAAPLANRPPRPRPVSPHALSGATITGAGTTAPGTPHPRASAPASSGATGVVTAPKPHPAATAASGSTGTQSTVAAERQAAPKAPPLSSTLNRNIIVLDPAHGAQDSGSRIGANLLEKDVDLGFAFRLRSLLMARGFTVVLTRDSDAALNPPASPSSSTPGTPLTLDDRAGIANHYRPSACLLLHATGRGTGVHLYTSALDPTYGEVSLLPWLTAQSAWVPASQQLENSISSALGRSHVSLLSSTASVRPVDSLTCPALVLELAPENNDPRSIIDAGYQDRTAAAVAGALIFWQNQVQPPAKLSITAPSPHTPVHHHAAAKASSTAPEATP